MTPEQHRRISDVFQEIVELPHSERAARLAALCAGNTELRREVETLLQHHHDEADDFGDANVGVGRKLVSQPQAPDANLPSNIGRFRIIRRLGEGGMGVVFEAAQDNPRRIVALKVIRTGLASDSVVRRFRHEAEVLGRLQHPGIADVYDAGVADTPLGRQPYFAMQLIQGRPLIDFAKERQLDPRARLALFARVCDAVQYAHQRGVIHRDLKPANILVDATGQPKILDFGVARATDDNATIATMQTATGQVIGTLPYMSPEQISGSVTDVDTRSDLYSLGVTLYELLAERLPYQVANCTLPEAARIIADVEPTHLSTIDRRFRGDVDTIVSKTLQKERSHRYQSVAELAADIRRYLADEPVLARPASAMYQLRKFTRRNKALVAGVLGTFVALLLGVAGVLWFAAGESRQRASAEAASSEARRLAYRVSVGAAADAIDDHNIATARRLLSEAPQELRGWEWRHLSTRLDDSFVQIRGNPPLGGWLHVRADGDIVQRTVSNVLYASIRTGQVLQRVDSARGFTIAVNQDATLAAAVVTPTRVALHQLGAGRPEQLPELPRPVRALCFSNDSTLLAVCDTAGALHFIDLNEHRCVRSTQLPRPASDMQFSPDDARIAANDADGLFVVDVRSGRVEQAVRSPGFQRLPRGCWTLDSQVILRRESAYQDVQNCIVPLVVATGERGAPWPAHHREVLTVELAPDGRAALVGWAGGLMRVCEVPGGATQLELRSEGSAAFGPIFSPDGTKIAFGELNGVIRVVDRANARPLAVLRGQEAATSSFAFSADGVTLFSTAEDGMIRGWHIPAVSEKDVLRGHTNYVYPVTFSPDGATLASGSWDQTIRLWDVRERRTLAVLEGHAGPVRALAFSSDGRRLVSTTVNGDEEFVWDLDTRAYLRLPSRNGALQESPAFFRDGKRIWLPGELGPNERVFNLASRAVETIPANGLRELADARVSPDRRWIARLRGAESRLVLVSLDDPSIQRTLAADIAFATFNPDGSKLVTAMRETSTSADSTVAVWDVAAGRQLLEMRGHIGGIFDARFSPDGRRLATAGRDASIRIWDGATFDRLVRLRGHQDYVWSIAWSPDGRTLASGSGDNTVRVWRTDDYVQK